MSTRVHTTGVKYLAVEVVTSTDRLVENYGGDFADTPMPALVLHDNGNDEAWVMVSQSPNDLVRLAGDITNTVAEAVVGQIDDDNIPVWAKPLKSEMLDRILELANADPEAFRVTVSRVPTVPTESLFGPIERVTLGHWDSDEAHPVSDWQYEVANGDTRLGYHAWLAKQEDA